MQEKILKNRAQFYLSIFDINSYRFFHEIFFLCQCRISWMTFVLKFLFYFKVEISFFPKNVPTIKWLWRSHKCIIFQLFLGECLHTFQWSAKIPKLWTPFWICNLILKSLKVSYLMSHRDLWNLISFSLLLDIYMAAIMYIKIIHIFM